jgi:protocatechuate 3,4-dioxygenase beta subunit
MFRSPCVRALGVFVSAILIGSTPAAEPARKLSASGTVRDAQGKPVAGATVYLRQWPSVEISGKRVATGKEVLATTTTDMQGQFAFRDVAATDLEGDGIGNYSFPWDLVATAEGHGFAFKPLTSLEQEQPLALTLGAEDRLRGRLVDRDGKPVAGARVEVIDVQPLRQQGQAVFGAAGYYGYANVGDIIRLSGSQFQPKATSDAEGRFVLPGLSRDLRATVEISAPGFAREKVNAATTDQPQQDLMIGVPGSQRREKVHIGDFTVKLRPEHRLTGQVLAKDTHKPIAGARVVCTTGNQMFDATADADGQFTLRSLPAGKGNLTASPPVESDHLAAMVAVDLPADRPEVKQNVDLESGCVVAGQVVDKETGKGIAAVNVMFQGQQGNYHAAATGPDGTFRLVVRPGTGTLQVTGSAAGYFVPQRLRGLATGQSAPDDPYMRPVEAKLSRAVTGVKFTLGRGLVVSGRVVDTDGKAVSGARIAEGAGAPFQTRHLATTDADGRFTLSGLNPEGKQELTITHPKRKLATKVPVEGRKGTAKIEGLQVKLQPMGSVTGRAVGEDKKPIGGAAVSLMIMHQHPEGYMSMNTVTTGVTTGADGRFAVETLVPGGQYYVQVEAKDFAGAQSVQFEAKTGQAHPLGDLVLPKADQSLAGTVVDPTGKPLAGVSISCSANRGMVFGINASQIVTDKKGRFRVTGLPRGPVRLIAQVVGEGPTAPLYVQTQANAGQQDVRLVLFVPTKPANQAAAGKPAPGFAVAHWLNRPATAKDSGFSPQDFRGQVVVLAFVDETKPSQRLLARLDQVQAKRAGQGLVVLRVYETATEGELAKLSPTAAALVAPGAVPGGYSAAFQTYAVRATPTLFLVDRQGVLRHLDVELDDLDARLDDLLKP